MSTLQIATVLLLTAVVAPVSPDAQDPAPESADRIQIRAAALDYGEGWYEGSVERMERALHPELAKRIVYRSPGGRSRLDQQSAMTLVRMTRAGGGSRSGVEDPRSEVVILDVHENAASAKVVGPQWVDYLHLARWDGRWVIVNVLWEPLPELRELIEKSFAR